MNPYDARGCRITHIFQLYSWVINGVVNRRRHGFVQLPKHPPRGARQRWFLPPHTGYPVHAPSFSCERAFVYQAERLAKEMKPSKETLIDVCDRMTN